MQYLLIHRCPGATSTPLYWGQDKGTEQVFSMTNTVTKNASPVCQMCDVLFLVIEAGRALVGKSMLGILFIDIVSTCYLFRSCS